MLYYLIEIFFISFLINLLWEVVHSQLYITCLIAPLKRFISLIIFASLKDGFFVTLFFLISVWIFKSIHILENPVQLIFFVFLSLLFSFLDEKISLKMGRWKYSLHMPLVQGIGISPLLELAVTGIASFLYVFMM